MALDISGSNSLYWKAGIDYSGMKADSAAIVGLVRKLSAGVIAVNPFALFGVAATAGFAQASRAAYGFSKDFDAAMTEVKTISKVAQQDFAGLSNEIIKLSKEIPQSADALARAYYQIVSSGYDGADAIKILEQAAKGAVAGFTDTLTVADAAVRIMQSYGEEAGSVENVMDKLFRTVEVGVIRMDQLSNEIGAIVGIADQAGVSFDELMAAIAEGSKTLQASRVTEGLRGILAAIIQNTDESKKAAKELGLEFGAAALRAKGFQAFLADVYDKTSNGENVEALNKLFGRIEGLTALLALFQKEGKGYSVTLDQMADSAGANARAFDIAIEQQKNQAQLFKNNLFALLKPLGDAILGMTNNVLGGINSLFQSVDDSFRQLSVMSKTQASAITKMADRYKFLSDQTERTKEQDEELLQVTQDLYAYMGDDAVRNIQNLTGAVDLYNVAQERSRELTKEALGFELDAAKMRKERLEFDLELFKLEEDKSKKELERAKNSTRSLRWTLLQNAGIIDVNPTGATSADSLTASYEQIKRSLRNIDTEKVSVDDLRDSLNKLKNDELSLVDARNLLLTVYDRALSKNNDYRESLLEEKRITLERTQAGRSLQQNLAKETAEIRNIEKALLGLNETAKKTPKAAGGTKGAEKFDLQSFEDQIDTVRSGYESFFKVVQTQGKANAEVLFKELLKNGDNYGAFLDEMEKKYKGNNEALKVLAIERANYVLDTERRIGEARIALENETNQNRYQVIREWDERIAKSTNETERALYVEGRNRALQKFELEDDLRKLNLSRAESFSKIELSLIKDRLLELQRLYPDEAQKIGGLIDTIIKAIGRRTEDETRQALERTGEEAVRSLGEVSDEWLRAEKIRLEKVQESLELYSDEWDNVARDIRDITDEIWNRQITKIQSIGDAVSALGDLIGKANTGLGKALNDVGSMVRGVSDIQSALRGDNKNMWGAIAGGIGVVSTGVSLAITAVNAFNGGMEESERAIERVNAQIERLSYETEKYYSELRRSTGQAVVENTVATYNQLSSSITQNIQALNDFRVSLTKTVGAKLGDIFRVDESNYETLLNIREQLQFIDADEQTAINALIEAITKSKEQMADLREEYNQILTGTTAPTIAESIADGFRQGLNSANDFAETFEQLLRTAVIQSFERSITSKYLDAWYTDFVGAMEDNQLSPNELAGLTKSWDNAITKIGLDFEQLKALTGVDLVGETTKKQGLAGEIKGITEQTAGVLSGQLNAMRIDVKGLFEGSKISQMHLSGIRDNTLSLAQVNQLMNAKLDRLIDLTIDIADSNRLLRNINTNIARLAAMPAPTPGPGLRGVGGAY